MSDEFAFCESLKECSFFQVNCLPTHFSNNKSNILDLIISNEPERPTNFESLSPDSVGISTDHHLLEFDVIVWNRRMKKKTRYVYNFKACNLPRLKDAIRQSTTLFESSNIPNVDEAWKTWKTELTKIIDAHAPKVKARSSETPPWFDGDVIHLLKRKETARRAAKRTNSSTMWVKFKQLRRELKHLMDMKFKEYTMALGESIKDNPKRFWSYFRCKTKTDSIPARVIHNKHFFTSEVDKAEAFNNFFFSTFTKDKDDDELPSSLLIPSDINIPLLDSIILSEE